MTAYRLALPFTRPVLTSNELRSRHHWATQRAAKRAVETAVWAVTKQYRVPRLEVCTIGVVWYPSNRRKRDADSLFPMAKAAIDGLRLAGVLLGDDARYVAGVLCWIGAVSRPARIELVISDCGGVEGLIELRGESIRDER